MAVLRVGQPLQDGRHELHTGEGTRGAGTSLELSEFVIKKKNLACLSTSLQRCVHPEGDLLDDVGEQELRAEAGQAVEGLQGQLGEGVLPRVEAQHGEQGGEGLLEGRGQGLKGGGRGH